MDKREAAHFVFCPHHALFIIIMFFANRFMMTPCELNCTVHMCHTAKRKCKFQPYAWSAQIQYHI